MGIGMDFKTSVGFVLDKKDFGHLETVVESIYESKPQFCLDTGNRIEDKQVLKKRGYSFHKIGDIEEEYFPEFVDIFKEYLQRDIEAYINVDHFWDQYCGQFNYIVVGLAEIYFEFNDRHDYKNSEIGLSDIQKNMDNYEKVKLRLEELGFKPGEIKIVNGVRIL